MVNTRALDILRRWRAESPTERDWVITQYTARNESRSYVGVYIRCLQPSNEDDVVINITEEAMDDSKLDILATEVEKAIEKLTGPLVRHSLRGK